MPCADLLIIGGGSSGAALAYEAVRRGLKVTLLEAEDPAVGTSSRSTKLLHGGVRYLELAVKKRIQPSSSWCARPWWNAGTGSARRPWPTPSIWCCPPRG